MNTMTERLAKALEDVLNSSVVQDAPYVSYSETIAHAKELLREYKDMTDGVKIERLDPLPF